MPGDVNLWPNLTGGEAIDILSRLTGGLDVARKNRMLERFELDPTKKARAYSKGNRQKVALVAALASDAELLLLDEPTSGLDPLMEAAFTESIREVKAAGRSVLLSSHIFAEVEKLADRVTIIRDGATVESGTIAELRHLTRTQVTVVIDGGVRQLEKIPGVHDVLALDGHVTVRRRRRRASRRTRRSSQAGSPLADGQSAVARGVVPSSLRRRTCGLERRREVSTATAPRLTAPTATRRVTDTLTGLPTAIRLILRRNRVRLVVWWLVVVGLIAYVGSYYTTLFPDQASLDEFATLSNTPAIKALTGLAAAPNTLGGAVWTKAWMSAALSLAFGVAFLVTRSGRADEELGRTELLRSRVLGLHAYAVASWLVNGALCVAIGAGVAFASAAVGLDPAGAGYFGLPRLRSVRCRARVRRDRGCRDRRPGGIDLPRRERARRDRSRRLLRPPDGGRPRQRRAHVGLAHRLGPANGAVCRKSVVAAGPDRRASRRFSSP